MSFDYALNHPFAPQARGARIPDEHSFPTVCYTTTANFTVFSPGAPPVGGGPAAGDVDFIITPNPLNAIITSYGRQGRVDNGAIPEVAAINGLGSATVSGFFGDQIPETSGRAKLPDTGVIVPPAAAPAPIAFADQFQGQWGGVTNIEAIANSMSTFRVVGFGARIRSLVAPLNQAGQVIMMTQPAPMFQPPCSESSIQEWRRFCNYPSHGPDGFLTTQMLQNPASDINMYAELTAEGGIEWCGRMTGDECLDFRDADFGNLLTDSAEARKATQFVQTGLHPRDWEIDGAVNRGAVMEATFADTGVEMVQRNGLNNGNLGNYTQTTNMRVASSYNVGGWSCLFVRGTGIIPGVQGGAGGAPYPIFSVEVIYHLEGTPNINNVSLVASANTGVFDNSYFTKAVERSSREQWFRKIIDYHGFKGPQGDNPVTTAVKGLLSLTNGGGVRRSPAKRRVKAAVRRVKGAKRVTRVTNAARGRKLMRARAPRIPRSRGRGTFGKGRRMRRY